MIGRAILACALIGGALSAASISMADELPCGGIGMPQTVRAAFDNSVISKTGAFVIDGELRTTTGQHTCLAITIECTKQASICLMVDVPLVKLSGGWAIASITPQNEIPISQWNDDYIIASGDSGLCTRREVVVNLAAASVRVVQTDRCRTARPAETFYITP